ncbi:MAG TPA: CHAT domain-containing tetratricopeptide repeat protein [Steroidobacteraceae bacterium]
MAANLAGCGADLAPARPVHRPESFTIAGPGPQELQIRAPADETVLVTVSARDVDVRAAIIAGDAAVQYCDAPNRRMGVETLLVEAPHAGTFTVRLERNDHSGAQGEATVEAVGLPQVTGADRQRLEAARQDAIACIAFPDVARGEAAAAAYAAAAFSWGKAGDRHRQGLALLHESGARYLRQSDWKASSDLAARAFRALEGADAQAHAAYALRLEGAALDQLADATDYDMKRREGTIRRARERLTEAEARFRELAMPYEAGYAVSYRAVSIGEAGDFERSRAEFLVALGLFRDAGDGPAQALALQSLAFQSYEDGRSADAAQEFEEALALIPRDEDPANYAHTLHNSALPLRTLGRFDEGIARHHEAAGILRKIGDREGEARALHSLGAAMYQLGEPERAAELLRASIRLRGESAERRAQADALLTLGNIERDARRTQAALELDQQALAIVTAPHDRARALVSLARDYLATGNRALAREPLEEVLRLPLPARQRHRAVALAELGALESQDGNVARSEEYFARATAIHEQNGSDLEHARTLKSRAEARLRRGDTAGALADSASALQRFDAIGVQSLHAEARAAFRASYRDAVELRIATLVQAAEASRRSGDAHAVRRLLESALDASDRARAQLIAESSSFSGTAVPAELLSEREQAYELLAGKRQQRDRLLDSAQPDAERAETLLRDIELLRARTRLIEGRIARARAVAPGSRPDGTGTSSASAPRDSLAVEYFLGREQSWLFAVRDGNVEVHALGPGPALESLARELHLSWRKASPGAGNRLAESRRLAGILYGQLGDSAPAGGIRIVPDGALHLVPMALLARQAWPALPAGTAVVVPALATLQAEPLAGARPARTLVIVADPVYEAGDPRIRDAGRTLPATGALVPRATGGIETLRRLPSTAIEARELAAIAGDTGQTLSLVGPAASRENVIRAPLERYRILHFAAHALADSRDPALASIALSRFGADGRPLDGALRQYDITHLRLNADLVVLSGCDTALGREIAGEGPIGLAQAFLRSGARAVVATLWQVPDTSTAVFMREFYRGMLRDGRAPAHALALAQDHLKRQARWSDPYYWAGFQLVSNARLDAGNNDDVAGREE